MPGGTPLLSSATTLRTEIFFLILVLTAFLFLHVFIWTFIPAWLDELLYNDARIDRWLILQIVSILLNAFLTVSKMQDWLSHSLIKASRDAYLLLSSCKLLLCRHQKNAYTQHHTQQPTSTHFQRIHNNASKETPQKSQHPPSANRNSRQYIPIDHKARQLVYTYINRRAGGGEGRQRREGEPGRSRIRDYQRNASSPAGHGPVCSMLSVARREPIRGILGELLCNSVI